LTELTKRILFAVPAATLFISLAWIGGIYFNAVMALLAAGTIWEVVRLLKQSGRAVFLPGSYLLAGVVWFAAHLPDLVLFGGIAGVILITLVSFFTTESNWSQAWLSTLFCAIYTTLGYYLAAGVRDLGTGQEGFWLILALFLMIWGNDVFAYFGGKTFGKRKLAPNISPNKTWEGFWFGFLGACTGAFIAWFAVKSFPLTFLQLMPAAIITSITGPVGDLLESSMKRRAGMKDSSSLLPGHGGLFDRFDALILTAPFIYFYFTLFM
jgi:phosphatidate cytidylyltransferase